jgi:TrmH family RNA methyltransferase
MSAHEKIASLQNPKVKLIRQLRDKRGREQHRLFVIDYPRDLERALACGYEVEFLLTSASLGDFAFLKQFEVPPIFEVSSDLMQKVSYRENPSEIVAVMRQKPLRGVDDLASLDATLILGLVNLQKPGNIGALLRTADAAGFKAIFLIDTALDIYNPNIIRSSAGACFLDNIFMLTSEQALEFLKTQKYNIMSAVVDGSMSLYDGDFRHQTALILGTEDKGLSKFWQTHCDYKVRIPMVGQMTDSLNVSVSGAIMMYEALRQRSI